MMVNFKLKPLDGYERERTLCSIYELFRKDVIGWKTPSHGLLEMSNPQYSKDMEFDISTYPDIVSLMDRINVAIDTQESRECGVDEMADVEVRVAMDKLTHEQVVEQSVAAVKYICESKFYPTVIMYYNVHNEMVFRWHFTVDYLSFCDLLRTYIGDKQ